MAWQRLNVPEQRPAAGSVPPHGRLCRRATRNRASDAVGSLLVFPNGFICNRNVTLEFHKIFIRYVKVDDVIPDDFDFLQITSLSSEAKQKMNKVRPKSIAQAGRISGVSPADINVLLIYLGR